MTLTYTVIEDGVYEGKPVHRVVVGNDTNLYDVATSNAIATLRFGKEVSSTLPHDGMLSWPLYVDKSWTATFTFNNRLQGMTIGPVNVQYRVTASEDVTVPARHLESFKDSIGNFEQRLLDDLVRAGNKIDGQENQRDSRGPSERSNKGRL